MAPAMQEDWLITVIQIHQVEKVLLSLDLEIGSLVKKHGEFGYPQPDHEPQHCSGQAALP